MLPRQTDDAMHASCIRRLALTRTTARPTPGLPVGRQMWLVAVTLGGVPLDPEAVHRALDRLATGRPFLVQARYDSARAEIRYWEESENATGAEQLALGLWGDAEVLHRLPGWQVLGVTVTDRPTARRQWDTGQLPVVRDLGEITRFDADV